MNLLNDVKTGSSKALSVKNIIFMTITTIVVTLIISRILKNEIVLYDVNGKITGYGDIKPRLHNKSKKSQETPPHKNTGIVNPNLYIKQPFATKHA